MNIQMLFEDYAHKIAYLINIINSYFIIVGLLSFVIFSFIFTKISVFNNYLLMIFYILFLYFILRQINFFPYFLFFTPLFLWLLINLKNFSIKYAAILFLLNFILFFFTQIFNYYIPYLIVFKSIRPIFSVIFNSFFTISPTNSSVLISVYYSTFLSYFLFFQPNPINDVYALILIVCVIIAVLIVKRFVPKSYESPTYLPKSKKRIDRILYINIDGLRFDKFKIANVPFLSSLKKKGVYFSNGARSVNPALTNPAFVSILTGVTPEVHGIVNNNINRGYKYEALPDVVKTSNYGNIHFNDVSKKSWDTNIFEISRYGLGVDDKLFEKLEEDLLKKGSRLFMVDISLLDMIGHVYGSYSQRYLDALSIVDKKIEKVFLFLENRNLLRDMVVIISSDHGHAVMDHGYTLFRSENEVPLIIIGRIIKKNKVLDIVPSICDLTVTISYLLGVRYPEKAKGRVLIEILN